MSVCLAMIVKNEAHCIIRCLDSVKPLMSCGVVCDTGSTDDTIKVMSDWAAANHFNLQIYRCPWVDFAHNRTESLRYARGMGCDFTMVIDADDYLVIPDGFEWPSIMDADAYEFQIKHNLLLHNRVQLLNNKHNWYYKSVIHEYPHYDSWDTGNVQKLKLTIHCTADGARRSNYEATRDADTEVLRKAVKDNPQHDELGLRYRFCLGVHLREHLLPEQALPVLIDRAEIDAGWLQERYMCYIYAADCAEKLNHDTDSILALYAKANMLVRTRADGYYGMARLCRRREKWDLGMMYARKGFAIPKPAENPVLHEPWKYDHGLLFEFAQCAKGAGQYETALRAFCALWFQGHLKDNAELLEQIRLDAIFCTERLT